MIEEQKGTVLLHDFVLVCFAAVTLLVLNGGVLHALNIIHMLDIRFLWWFYISVCYLLCYNGVVRKTHPQCTSHVISSTSQEHLVFPPP